MCCVRVLACWLLLVCHARADVPAEDVEFKSTADGTSQRYVIVKPESPPKDGRFDVLVALHGHGSDRWQFVRAARDECRAARDAATRHHMLYVSPDYRAKTSWMGPLAEADVVQILKELKLRYPIKRVILTGGSMGGSSALTFAALHPDLVAGVAAMNGTANHLEYTQFQDAISESFGGTKAKVPEEYKRRSAEYWPERLSMPIGVTTGGRDLLVPPGSVQRLAGVLKQIGRPALLIHRDETGHETNYDDATTILEFAINPQTSARE